MLPLPFAAAAAAAAAHGNTPCDGEAIAISRLR